MDVDGWTQKRDHLSCACASFGTVSQGQVSKGREREGGWWLDSCWAEIKEAITNTWLPFASIMTTFIYMHTLFSLLSLFVCLCLFVVWIGWSSSIHPPLDNCYASLLLLSYWTFWLMSSFSSVRLSTNLPLEQGYQAQSVPPSIHPSPSLQSLSFQWIPLPSLLCHRSSCIVSRPCFLCLLASPFNMHPLSIKPIHVMSAHMYTHIHILECSPDHACAPTKETNNYADPYSWVYPICSFSLHSSLV